MAPGEDPELLLAVYVATIRMGDYVPDLSDQQLVDAGIAVCEFFDRTPDPDLLAGYFAIIVTTRGPDSDPTPDPIEAFIVEWIAGASEGDEETPRGG
jgi:hypothetical protein